MTPQEKLQANKLLATFDGLETQPLHELDWTLFDMRNNPIDYSEDWNLLMSVAEKLAKGYPFGNKYFDKQNEYKNGIFTALQRFDKDHLFGICAKFITLKKQMNT